MSILMKKLKVAGGSIAISLAIGLGLSAAPNTVYADDTEIFFGEAKTANLLLVLDESGSMSFKDSDAAADEVLVNYWQQRRTEKVENLRARLVGVAEDKARFATLQAYTRAGWTDYVPYNTQFNDRLAGWDLTRAYKDVYYRWIYKDKIMADVSFDINGPRWRVWSSKNLWYTWIGEWKVQVLRMDGSILYEKIFNYTDKE